MKQTFSPCITLARVLRMLLVVLLTSPTARAMAAEIDTVAFICTSKDSMEVYTGATIDVTTSLDLTSYPMTKGDVIIHFAQNEASLTARWVGTTSSARYIRFSRSTSSTNGNSMTISGVDGKTIYITKVRFTFDTDNTPTATTGWFASGSCTLTTYSSYEEAVWTPESGTSPDSVRFWNDGHTSGTWFIRTIRVYYTDSIAETSTDDALADSVDVTISSVGYATLYYGAYNLQVPVGVTAYTTALTESESGYTATLTAIEEDDEYDAAVIPAGTAVILYSGTALSSGTSVSYSFPVVSSYTGSLSGTNDLLGTDTATVVGTSSDGYLYYQLSQDANETAGSIGFYWGTSDGETLSNGAHKGYLRVKKSSDSDSSGVKAISLALPTGDADEAPSAITSSASGVALPEGIYTLTGMRLSTTTDVLPAGCYIIDGRKVLIR